MAEKQKKPSPPYATFGSFVSFLNKLRETSIPSRIDPSVFGNVSGSVSYSVISSLKYLNLIDEDGRPTNEFVALVNAPDDNRQALIASVVRNGYPSLFSSQIDLTKATAAEFDEHVRSEFGIQGSTVDKVAAFFIAAAKAAAIEISPHLTARKPIYASPTSRKSAKQRKRDDDADKQTPPPPPVQQISEKALEYRLVDLMTEAAGQQQVMNAIITVITFLKTKDVTRGGSQEEVDE
ncbi:MAG: DUF5343 domain-containing protein [Pseudomonadota bacterium]